VAVENGFVFTEKFSVPRWPRECFQLWPVAVEQRVAAVYAAGPPATFRDDPRETASRRPSSKDNGVNDFEISERLCR
jgi:hypothetical protein